MAYWKFKQKSTSNKVRKHWNPRYPNQRNQNRGIVIAYQQPEMLVAGFFILDWQSKWVWDSAPCKL